jgi:HEAT repeat protein
MFARLCTALFLLGSTDAVADLPEPAAIADARPAPVEEKVLKAIDAWLKAWRAGKIDFTVKGDITKTSIAAQMGVLPKGLIGTLTCERELDVMLEQAVALDTAEAAESVLEVTAAGLEDFKEFVKDAKEAFKETRKRAPYLVREMGEKWLVRFKSAAARDLLLKAARCEIKADRAHVPALAAAALRALGTMADPVFRAPLEQGLANAQALVRQGAAEGLQRLGSEASVESLAQTLEREESESVVLALVAAIRKCYARFVSQQSAGKEPGIVTELPEASRLAVRSAIKALGRTGWRTDLELVAFLDDFRSPETIPALIEVLQRFKSHPEEVTAGKLSTLLLHRVHETLVSMTGAVIPLDQPEKWREFWERERDKIKVAPKKNAVAAPGGTVASLFGIPVQGSRISFVIDLSGSMDFPMKWSGTGTSNEVPDKLPSRLDVAKRELHKLIDSMPDTTMFNCVVFHGDPTGKKYDAAVWSKTGLLQANTKNKDDFRKFVTDMKADGGTNLWSGLQEALKMKSLVYGQRYETNLDELFIISDGAPNLGEIHDAAEILRVVDETNKVSRMRINTVFITSPNERNPTDQSLAPDELMKRLAEDNGGKFVKISS